MKKKIGALALMFVMFASTVMSQPYNLDETGKLTFNDIRILIAEIAVCRCFNKLLK